MLKSTTAAVILLATALLTAGCSGDSGTETSPATTEASPTSVQSEPATIPAADWTAQVEALCAAEVSEVSKIAEPDTNDSAAMAVYIGQVQESVSQLSADIAAVGVPDQNEVKAAKLAEYFAQSAAILESYGPDANTDEIAAQVNKLVPKMDALAKQLDVPSCGS